MAFQLRVATAADIPAIQDLIAASVRALQVEYAPAEREAALATVFTVDSRLVADGTYFIAHAEDGRTAGCGGWSRRKTLYGGDHQIETVESELLDPWLNPGTDAAKIRAIFVHPAFARMRLGSLILRASEEAAQQAGFSRFEMGSTLTGVALYTLQGYRETGRINVPVSSELKIGVVRMVKESETM